MRFIKDIYQGNYPISQYFGENPQLYEPMGLSGHNGIDISLPVGVVLLAGINGVVTSISDQGNRGYGKHIRIATEYNDRYFELLWGHLSQFANLKVSDIVGIHDTIGISGNSGFCVTKGRMVTDLERAQGKGAHLHFQIRELDEEGNVINYNNGFKGAIDPLPFFNL